MAQNQAAKLFINGTFIPTIAGSIKASTPIEVYKTQQVSRQSGVGTVGYQSLEDSTGEIGFTYPLIDQGVIVLDLIKSALTSESGGSSVVVVDQSGQTVYEYFNCYPTERESTEFNGEQNGGMTLVGTPST